MTDEFYVICRLTSGEQVMAVLDAEDDKYVVLIDPILIKSIPTPESYKEKIAAQPLCQFSDDNKFIIHKQNILFVKKLHHVFVHHYQRIVSEYAETTLIEAPQEDELPARSPEEARKLIDILKEVLGEETEEDKPLRNFIKGNDTIN